MGRTRLKTVALTRSRTKPTTEEKPSRRKADENPEEDSRAGGRKERLRLRRKYWGAEGLGYGIDRSIVFGRHCPQDETEKAALLPNKGTDGQKVERRRRWTRDED